MAKLTLTSFVTLDGIVQAPGGATEDRSGGFMSGGWLMPFADETFGKVMVDIFSRAGAFLLGRGTYEIFASYWPLVTDSADPVATALNRLPKYVASRTLTRADWKESTVLRDVRGEVARLKARDGGELQVHGSPGLAQTLLENELVDTLHLLQFPLVLGTGKRLFGSGTIPTTFELVAVQTTSTGVVVQTLRPLGRPTYQSVEPPTTTP